MEDGGELNDACRAVYANLSCWLFTLMAVSWPGEVLALGGDEVTVYGNSQHCLRTIFVNLKLSLIFRKGKQKLA